MSMHTWKTVGGFVRFSALYQGTRTFLKKLLHDIQLHSGNHAYRCDHCAYEYPGDYFQRFVYCPRCDEKYADADFFLEATHQRYHPWFRFTLCPVCTLINPRPREIYFVNGLDNPFSCPCYIWEDDRGEYYTRYAFSGEPLNPAANH